MMPDLERGFIDGVDDATWNLFPGSYAEYVDMIQYVRWGVPAVLEGLVFMFEEHVEDVVPGAVP